MSHYVGQCTMGPTSFMDALPTHFDIDIMSKNNRRKGHNWEREVAKDLRDRGIFPKAATSRYVSRQLDDAKIDIANTGPYGIQCKCSHTTPDYRQLIPEMAENCAVPVVAFKDQKKSKTGKWLTQGRYVIMKYDDFLELIAKSK